MAKRGASGSKRVGEGVEELQIVLEAVGLSMFDLALAYHRLLEADRTLFCREVEPATRLLESLVQLVDFEEE